MSARWSLLLLAFFGGTEPADCETAKRIEVNGAPVGRLSAGGPIVAETFIVETENGVYRTEDGGKSWNRIADRFEGNYIFTSKFPERIYSQHSQQYTVYQHELPSPIKVSNDGGKTWYELSTKYINPSAVHPEDPDRIYGTSNGNLHESADGGRAWDELSFLPDTGFRAIVHPREWAYLIYDSVSEGGATNLNASKNPRVT